LRHAEDLNEIEEEVVHVCEPETGRNLNDEDEEKRRSVDPINYQVGSEEESPDFQLGKGREMRLCEGLMNSEMSSDQRGVLMEMGSLEDLIDFQEGREEIPCCQVGKGEKMGLFNSLMNSEVSLDQ
jgi:hypothetical protein